MNMHTPRPPAGPALSPIALFAERVGSAREHLARLSETSSYTDPLYRRALSGFIADAIDALDALDRDPDLELEEDSCVTDQGHDLLDSGDGDRELGWANEGDQSRLHGTDGDGEPMLGAVGTLAGTDHLRGWRGLTIAGLDEAEEENEHGGDIQDEPHDDNLPGPESWGDRGGADNEPSLGSLGGTAAGSDSQRVPEWAAGKNDDREEEHDGREDGHDAEAGTDDNGIADDDGRAEQWGATLKNSNEGYVA